ncbi:glycosyltransferase involved in cell wall biosynthesis [Chelatococcus asaccharovorans]|uniref:Glycosyltransferase involved in cell wall biosynthesis n=1 Tax=Chelatococcus asaccharovorans TaxID=28210 RepID=A0A2V3TUU5_9HYPH|nr:glycosyltransferase involved in cell wall biosynthesis [Chelatococcus asaccharovorans]
MYTITDCRPDGALPRVAAAHVLRAQQRVVASGAPATERASGAAASLAAGIACFRKGDLPAAHVHFRAAGRLRPDHPDGPRWLARTLRGLSRQAEAVAAWLRVLSILPEDFEALLRCGEAGVQGAAGADHPPGIISLADAETCLLRAAALRPADVRPLRLLAQHYLWSGRLDAARQLLCEALVGAPRAVALWQLVLELIGACYGPGLKSRVLRRMWQRFAGAPDRTDRLFLADVLAATGAVERARRLLEPLVGQGAAAEQGSAAGQGAARAQVLQRLGLLALAQGQVALASSYARRPEAPDALIDAVAACAAHQRLHHAGGGLSHPSSPNLLPHELPTHDWISSWLAGIDRIRRSRRPLAYEARPGAILHVLNSLGAGGTERQCALLAGQQKAQGREVEVICTDPRRGGRGAFFRNGLRQAGVRVATLADYAAVAAGVTHKVPLLAEPPEPVRGLVNLREIAHLAAAIMELRPEVVQAWTPQAAAHAALAGIIAGVPRVVMRGGSIAPGRRDGDDEGERARHAVMRRLLRAALADRSVILANNSSRNLADWLDWLGLEADVLGARAITVPNGIDADWLRGPGLGRVCPGSMFPGHGRPGFGSALHRRYGIAPDAIVIGGVMRLEREKDPELWLEVVARLCGRHPALHGLLIGCGRLRPLLEAEVHRRGLAGRITLAGMVAGDLADHYDRLAVLLLTSHFEGLPNVLIEAQARGVPVVAPDVGGVAEAMQAGETGLLVSCREPRDLAAAVTTLLGDEARRLAMGSAGRNFAARFAPEAVTARWEAVYGRSSA